MTIHTLKTVSTMPTLLTPPKVHSGVDITIQNVDASANIYIGSSSVATTNYGYKLAAGQAISFVLKSNDELYAISDLAPAGSNVAILTVGIN